MTWFEEVLHNAVGNRGYMQRIEVTRWIARHKSDFQDIAIFESKHFGRVLTLDGIVQTTEADEPARCRQPLIFQPVARPVSASSLS